MNRLRRALPAAMLPLVPGSLSAQSVGPLEEHVTILGTIHLEESDSVMTVTPLVAPDPLGGFFVVDPQDGQVRLYDEDGRLKKLVARSGSGPGEVRTPSAAVRRGDGNIFVADPMAGHIVEFDRTGSAARREWLRELHQMIGVHVVDDRILVQYANGSHRDEGAVLRLACVTRDGETLFDVAGTPRLLTVVGDRLYFVDAESLTDDRWVVESPR